MARCPNCGREAARTRDWVCQWCGFPLTSGNFKKLEKTFRELKEEEQPQFNEKTVASPAAEPEPVKEKAASKPAAKAEPPVTAKEAVVNEEPAPAAEKAAEAKPPEVIILPAPGASPESAAQTEPVKPQEPQAVPESVAPPQPAPVPQPVPEIRPETLPEVTPQPAREAIEITVTDLLSAYETEGPAADARFANRLLRLTGIVDRINVQLALDIYSVMLIGDVRSVLFPGVRCVFDAKNASELSRLSVGQSVTVEGRYNGSIIDISLRDCSLVR